MINKESYHGRLIEVMLEQESYSFQGWLPGEMIAIGDRQVYTTGKKQNLLPGYRLI